jgi:DNA-binding MarR family transcriptional regulator
MTAGADEESSPPLLGALLRISWEHMRARMLEGLHARGHTDLVAAHLNILQYPGPDGTRPSELAARTGMTKQALNYLIGQLEHLGYLTREADPEDHRSKRITLTVRGHEVERAIREIVREVEDEWEHALGPQPLAQLRTALRRLRTLIDS